MYNGRKIAIIGGDTRSAVCSELLGEKGFEVAACGFEKYQKRLVSSTRCLYADDAARQADAIVLPIPYSKDHINVNAPFSSRELRICDVTSNLKSGALVLGGRLDGGFIDECRKFGGLCFDYGDNPCYKTLNAIPTAEAAIAIAIEETARTLHGARCLVISYGKVGSALSSKLKALGAEVTVMVRNEKYLPEIFLLGYKGIMSGELASVCEKFDLIFNAAPERVITEEIIKKLSPDVFIVDLSSMPGGVDTKCAKALGINTVHALSLPGKYAPVSAGEYLANTVINILNEGAKA